MPGLGTHVANFSIVGIQKCAEKALPTIKLKIKKVKPLTSTLLDFITIDMPNYLITFVELKFCLAGLSLTWAAADSFGLAPIDDEPDVKF